MVETKMLQAGGLMVISLALFIGSWISWGLFKDKNCNDSSSGGQIQNVNVLNIILSIFLFIMSVLIYMEKVVLTENQFIIMGFVLALVLFIAGLVQYNAIKDHLSACDQSTKDMIKNYNMLVWIVALMALVLTGYMYFTKNKDDLVGGLTGDKKSFRFFMK